MSFTQRACCAAIAAMAVTGCAGALVESRVRAGLVEAGLSGMMASCMAKPMAEKLSIGQLRRLRSLGAVRNSQKGSISVAQFLHNVRALQDPEIVAVTGRAALGCAF